MESKNYEGEDFEKVKNVFFKLNEIWKELGLDSNQTAHRSGSVWIHVHNLLEEILDEEINYCNSIKNNIQNYSRKIEELASVLKVTPNIVEGSLILKEELLKKEIEVLCKLRNDRLKSYQDLKNIESKYCQILGYDEHHISPQVEVPSGEDILELQQHINMLQNEKENRYKKFCSLKADLAAIYKEIDLEPETHTEKEIMCGLEPICLSNETFAILDGMMLKAQKVKSDLETQRKDLVEKLTVLWTRLNIAENERMEFLKNHQDLKITTIKLMKKELQRCEDMKRANLKYYIDNLRVELEDLWSKACISDSEKPQLPSEVSDQALEDYESEVEKWKAHYLAVKHILEKIEKRQKLFNLLLAFDKKAMDPNRFKNRKGNLLKEERERNKLQKDLPALETEIFEDIQEYEAEHGAPFLYSGEDFRTVVTQQWADRINQKESVKLERHKQHLLQLVNTTTPIKRSVLTTPKTAPSKMAKLATSQFATPAPSERARKIPSTMGKFTMRCKKLLSSQKKGQQRQVLKDANASMQASCDLTSYSNFVKELNSSKRYQLRSSVLATRKPGGTRISQSSKRKSLKPSAKSNSVSSQSPRFTPTGGKCDLPIII